MYERWRLEDFEVVAFCYSPVPTGGLQPLLSKEDAASQAAISSLTRHSSASVSGVNAHSAIAGGGDGRAASLAAVGRAASVISPFVPAKHNTLFFVDPITTQDLHRIAAGITSKSKGGGGGLKANAHRNNSVNAAQGAQVVKSNEGSNDQDQEDAVEDDYPRDDGNQNASLYDFYPDGKKGEDGTVSKDTHEVEERLSSAAAMPRAASFTLTTTAGLPSLTRPAPSDQHSATATARRSGEATPVKNPLRATDDINYIPEAYTSRSPTHSPPQGQSKNSYPPQPPAAEEEAHPPAGSRNTAVKSNRSRSDASYTGHTATALRLAKAGHLITKSMSLDRVSEYAHADQRLGGSEGHGEGNAAGLGKHAHTHSDEDSLCVSDSDSLLLPVPLPGALHVSTSDRDVRVKEHGGKDKVIAQQQGQQGRATYQPRTPVLHFPDDDDASSVASSVLTPSTISSAQTGKSVFGRAATVETSNPTRSYDATAATGIGVRFGLLDSEEEASPTDLGLTLDPVDALEQPDSGGFSPVSESDADAIVKRNSSFTRSHTFHVTAPPPPSSSNSEKLHTSGTMTPPLVPRNSFQTAKSTTVNALLSPTLRQNASEYAHPQHRFHHHRHHVHHQVGGMYSGHVTTSKQRHAQQVQRSHQQSRQLRRASTRQLWTQMRQQVRVLFSSHVVEKYCLFFDLCANRCFWAWRHRVCRCGRMCPTQKKIWTLPVCASSTFLRRT